MLLTISTTTTTTMTTSTTTFTKGRGGHSYNYVYYCKVVMGRAIITNYFDSTTIQRAATMTNPTSNNHNNYNYTLSQ